MSFLRLSSYIFSVFEPICPHFFQHPFLKMTCLIMADSWLFYKDKIKYFDTILYIFTFGKASVQIYLRTLANLTSVQLCHLTFGFIL